MARSLRARGARLAGALGLAGALLLPALAPVAAADPLVLKVGGTQDNDSLNPYGTALVVGYEAFLLSYQLLVDFGPDLEAIPGFAETWERAADGKSWTFTFRDDMLWSDGEPATSADACFSFQLALDAIANEGSVGLGYIDPSVADAGLTKVECPDPTTMIAYTEDASGRILQTYVPILPKHVWGEETWETIGNVEFEPPLVGSGPYQAQEWKTGQYIRFARNPNFALEQGAADEVYLQFFSGADTMLQALKAGEIDYAAGINADQLKSLEGEAGIETVVGTANGWTQLGFNAYGEGTGNVIPDGGPSSKALLDPAFRDALGYAIDKELLVERVLGGFGDVGTTIVPPVLSQWHVEPANPRTFDIEVAKQKLDAAGYALDGDGKRLDKEGNVLNLRLYMPDSDANYPKAAEFIEGWFDELGIGLTTQVFDSDSLVDLMLPPEAGEGYTADYDLFIWGWSGNPDPNGLLQIFLCSAIGSSSDSNWCNEQYDTWYDEQNAAQTAEERAATLDDMQQLAYDDAPYHILFYDANLHAYRTDRFTDWQKQPSANGTPLYAYGTLNYTLLKDATAVPSPEPSPSAGASSGASAAPSASPDDGGSTGGEGDNTVLIVALVALAAIVVVGLVLVARRRGGGSAEEE
jgi:peptide/nickel transport system substrate-binding protein